MERVRNKPVAGMLALAWVLGSSVGMMAQGKKSEAKPEKSAIKLKVGDMAPDFELKYQTADGLKSVALHDYKGKKNVVVAFFVFAFTGG